ncbi:MAG TPA: DnaJ C-terminal domain-containing protein [Kineosporiaceae bacterium]|nr:DnaJ C-terminal domain-containing protein [Kineosporiaceae bacterium]
MASQDWFEKDFYAVLGVPADASADDVKKAYRKLARKHHPDANSGDPSAEKRFKEIGEAYAVLSDPEQRQQYDAVRAMSRGGARFTAGGPNGGNGGFDDVFSTLFGGAAPGARNVRFTPGASGGAGGAGSPMFEDLLGSMFGGNGPGGAYRSPRGPRRGEDLTTSVNLTLRQAVEGAQLSLRVDDPQAGQRVINARVPPGVRDGQKVRLRGKGRPGDPGAEDGDLVVTVHVEADPVFTADGSDLRITVPITFPEAALGAQIEVPTFDGGSVRVKVPAGTPSGRTLRVRGHGVRTPKRTGDLLVTVQVAVPQRVDGPAREALEAYAARTAGEDPRADLLARVRRASGAGDAR